MPYFRLLLCSALCWLGVGLAQALPVSEVVIDAGHGGHDNGQVVRGVYEKWLTLDVAFRLEKLLRAKGIKCVLTRRDDRFVALPDRVAIANSRSKKALFVSIHFNGSRNTGASGLETFYHKNQGKTLAIATHRRLVPALGGINRGVKFASYHVLKNNQLPAILIEGGFLTNSAERNRCLTGKYRQAMAEAIAKGILDYKAARQAIPD